MVAALLSAFTIGASPVSLLLLLLSVLVMIRLLSRKNISGESSKLVVLSVIVISVFVMPAFNLVTNRHIELTLSQQAQIINFGSPIIVYCLVAWLLLKKISITSISYRYQPIHIPEYYLKIAFAIIFPISLFSYVMGIGRMGAEAVVLPFHLTGIFVFSQTKLFPALFMVFIENRILNGARLKKSYFIWYFLWSVLMTFVLLSKGILVSNFIPLFIMMYFYFKPSRYTILKYSLPIITFFFFMYPIIGLLRLSADGNSEITITSIIEASDDADEPTSRNDNAFLRPLNRTFKTGSHYIYDYPALANDDFFDFSRVQVLSLLGGSARYQTLVMENYPETAHHSSGSSGLMDPILFGGKGFMYIVVFAIMLMAAFCDRLYKKNRISIYALLIYFIFDLIANHNISLIYDFTSIIVTFLSIIIAYYANFRQKIVI